RMPTCSSCCSIGRRTQPCAARSSPTTLRSFMAFRVGLIGLGMAVTPHAKSLLDLSDRVEVAYAYSRSAERRAKFKQGFPFPQTARLEDNPRGLFGERGAGADDAQYASRPGSALRGVRDRKSVV